MRESLKDVVNIVQYKSQPGVLSAILAMEKRNFSKADSWAGILEIEVKRHNTFVLYAMKDRTVIGYIILTCSRLNAHISKVAVDKLHRQQGTGGKLVKASLKFAVDKRKILSASLHVDPQNLPAVKLYTKLGFTDDGLLEDYYAPGRPAQKMRLEMTLHNQL